MKTEKLNEIDLELIKAAQEMRIMRRIIMKNIFKKCMFLAVICTAMLCCFAVTVHAEIGDIKQSIYTTDIITTIDGLQIQGYSLDGRMMIVLEDLQNYGYTVAYDDSVRTLFVNKTDAPDPGFDPHFDRQEGGKHAGYTYETDIKAYLNGRGVYTEAIDGKLVAVAEDIAEVDSDDNLWAEYGTSQYFMTHSYDDLTRTLSLYSTAGSLTYEQALSDIYDNKKAIFDNRIQGELTILGRTDKENETIIAWKYANTGGSTGFVKIRKDGMVINSSFVLSGAYSFMGQTEMSIYSWSCDFDDDGNFIFEGDRTEQTGLTSVTSFEEGKYMMNTDTFIVTKIGDE